MWRKAMISLASGRVCSWKSVTSLVDINSRTFTSIIESAGCSRRARAWRARGGDPRQSLREPPPRAQQVLPTRYAVTVSDPDDAKRQMLDRMNQAMVAGVPFNAALGLRALDFD